jgi:hypothetical protein
LITEQYTQSRETEHHLATTQATEMYKSTNPDAKIKEK